MGSEVFERKSIESVLLETLQREIPSLAYQTINAIRASRGLPILNPKTKKGEVL